MKKIIAIILAAMMLLTLVACNTNDDTNNDLPNNENKENNNDNNNENNDDANSGDEADSGDGSDNSDENVELAYGSALDILTTAWNAFAEDQKFFVMGGDFTNPVDGAPGKFDLTAEGAADSLDGMTHYPTADFAKIDDAATIMHGMLANNFTGAAYHFTSADDATAMVDTLKTTLLGTQWWCGFPEKLVIISVPGDYLVVLFGLGEGVVDTFASNVVDNIAGAEIVVDQPLVEE